MSRTLADIAAARAALRLPPASTGRVHPQRVYDVADAIAMARALDRMDLIALARQHAAEFSDEGNERAAAMADFGVNLIAQMGREIDAKRAVEPPPPPASETPTCPDCGGAQYDYAYFSPDDSAVAKCRECGRCTPFHFPDSERPTDKAMAKWHARQP